MYYDTLAGQGNLYLDCSRQKAVWKNGGQEQEALQPVLCFYPHSTSGTPHWVKALHIEIKALHIELKALHILLNALHIALVCTQFFLQVCYR